MLQEVNKTPLNRSGAHILLVFLSMNDYRNRLIICSVSTLLTPQDSIWNQESFHDRLLLCTHWKWAFARKWGDKRNCANTKLQCWIPHDRYLVLCTASQTFDEPVMSSVMLFLYALLYFSDDFAFIFLSNDGRILFTISCEDTSKGRKFFSFREVYFLFVYRPTREHEMREQTLQM